MDSDGATLCSTTGVETVPNDRLIAARQKLRLTQAELASKVGVSRGYIALLEAGQRQPSLDVARRLSLTTGLPMEVFLANDQQ